MAPAVLLFVGITLSATCAIQGLPEENWRHHPGPAMSKQSLRDASTVFRARESGRQRVLPNVPPRHRPGALSPSQDTLFDLTPMDLARRRVDLLWTTWSSWSLCSRSCGGGTAMRSRLCKRRLPAKCEGSNIDYMLCNTQNCPPGKPTFRELQCGKRIGTLTQYEWIPYADNDGVFTCTLYCVAKAQRFIQRFGIAMDGTRCGRNDKDICIGGDCVKVGCDMVIGSTMAADACGVCGGNNATCYRYMNNFTSLPDNAVDFNYNEIAKIPAGAAHIFVRDYSTNFLALFEADEYFDRYVVNGHKLVSWPGEFKTAGTTLVYTRNNDTETFEIEGPTTKDLYIMILYLGDEPQIEYEYWIPNSLRPDYDEFAELKRFYSYYPEYNPFDYEAPLVPETTNPSVRTSTIPASVSSIAATTTTTTRKTTTTASTTRETTATTSMPPITTPRPPKQGGQPKPRTSLPTPVPLIKTSRCGGCKKPRNRKKFYCESDFAIHARIISRRRFKHGEQYRYDVEVITTYKSDFTLMEREYVWVPSACCPKLRPLRTYLLMGSKIKVDVTDERKNKRTREKTTRRRYETRLTITSSNYWAKWRKSYEKGMAKISQKLKCEKYLLRKEKKVQQHGSLKLPTEKTSNLPLP